MSRLTLRNYAIISLSLGAAVIGNAFYQKNQFYLACVYIMNSNASKMV